MINRIAMIVCIIAAILICFEIVADAQAEAWWRAALDFVLIIICSTFAGVNYAIIKQC